MENIVTNKLIKMIQIRTITKEMDANPTLHDTFLNLLKELFPEVFKKAEIKIFKGAILLRIKGTNSNSKILLMNHFDVVEEGEGWEVDPFEGVIKDGRLYGRGTLDTKGGLCCMLEALNQLLLEGVTFNKDIYIESSCNEETSGASANEISSYLKDNNIKFDFVLDEGGMIVFDPLGVAMKYFAMVGVGEKDSHSITFIAKDNQGHASAPNKDQGFLRLAKFINEIDRKKIFKAKLNNTTATLFKEMSPYAKGITKFLLAHPIFFKPLLTLIIPNLTPNANAIFRTTIAYTMASGSNCDNVIPSQAKITANLRYSHHQDKEASLKKIRKIATKYNIEIEDVTKSFKSNISSCTNKCFNNIANAISEIYPDIKTLPYIQNSASDSKYFSRVSNNCYRFVPFKINEEQLESIHGKNEYVNICDLDKAVIFYKNILRADYE